MKLLHIVGNRPQFIKLAPLMRALRVQQPEWRNVVVHSGQHYDYEMSRVFFEELGLPDPDVNLEVGSGSHGVQTGAVLARLDDVLAAQKPDVVLVYGDTNTTLAGALAAHKQHIPVCHVESGLRENVWRPEEINRKLADHCASYLFCPTPTAVRWLQREGIPASKIFLTGDITYDAFLWSCDKILREGISEGKTDPPYILMTLHRGETVDFQDALTEIVAAIEAIPVRVVFPVHPRTKKFLEQFGLWDRLARAAHVTLKPAVGYYDFLRLLMGASLVITDSGGVIKEAFYARKRCIVLDFTTEYDEILAAGSHIWAGKDRARIQAAREALERFDVSRIRPETVFGDGHAAEKMCRAIAESFVGGSPQRGIPAAAGKDRGEP